MSLLELKSKQPKTRKKRVGRGNGSNKGTYSCRGMKGQSARAGGRRRPGFEGGQTPYLRKMPKLKGFKNPNMITYQIINVSDLNVFEDNTKVDINTLYEKKLISKKDQPVKLLGNGEIEKQINITVEKASKEAVNKIEAKKGSVEQIHKPKKVKETSKKETPNKETPEQ